MYLLKKYGVVFLTVLVLLVLLLVFVILLYGYRGVLLPSFSFPTPETTAPLPETTASASLKILNLLNFGGTLK